MKEPALALPKAALAVDDTCGRRGAVRQADQLASGAWHQGAARALTTARAPATPTAHTHMCYR